MRRFKFAAVLALSFLPLTTHAASCLLTNFNIETYSHGGTYLHGTLAGQAVSWIVICGSADCNSKSTDRHLAIAIAAQAQGKNLLVYFESLASCAQFTPYATVTSLTLAP